MHGCLVQQSEDCELDGLSATCHETYRTDISAGATNRGLREALHAVPCGPGDAATNAEGRPWSYPCARECQAQSRRSAVKRRTPKPTRAGPQVAEEAAAGRPRRGRRAGAGRRALRPLQGDLASRRPTRRSRRRRRSSTTATASRSSAPSTTTRTATPSRSRRCRRQMQDAVVAAENQTFWTDQGIDPKGILRAAFSNARGNDRQGASTITQQYVKILYLSSEQSYQRKIKEAVVSLKIQNELSKARDPRGLPQHHLLRSRRLRHPGGRAGVLRQGRRRAQPARERGAGHRPQQPRRATTPTAARRRARPSRSATPTSSTPWSTPTRSPPSSRRRRSSGCRSSRRSRRRASTAASAATCCRW